MACDLDLHIEKLDGSHERSRFNCGKENLNEYLSRFARQNFKKGTGATYVAVEKGDSSVLGYYTISSGQVASENMPEGERKALPRYPIPVIRIGKLAVDLNCQRQGVGGILLIDAFRRAMLLSEVIGVYAIEVDAIDDHAKQFYEKFGFQSLVDDEFHLYISMKTIKRLFQNQ